jgi:hypothetical protein
MSDGRLNFSKGTRDALIHSVGANCVFSFPACCKPLTAFDQQSGKVKSIAFVAHAVAASPGGPRGQDGYTAAQIKAFGNGVVLCPTHANEVDVFESRYPTVMMTGWQKKAIEHRQAGAPAYPSFTQTSEGDHRAVVAVRLFMALADKPHIDVLGHSVSIDSYNGMYRLVSAWESDLSPVNPLHCGYPKLVQLQRSVVDAYRYIRSEVTSQFWFRNDSIEAYHPRIDRTFEVEAEQRAINNRASESLKNVIETWVMTEKARNALRRIGAGLDQPMFPNSI